MTPATKTSALDRLAELQREAHEAEQNARKLDAGRRAAGRRYESAKGDLGNYWRAVGAGDAPDPDRERELRETVRDFESRLMRREVTDPHSRHVRVEYVDPEHEGRLFAAQDEAQLAASAVVEFVRAEREALEAEMTERSLAARDGLLAAVDELSSAAGEWSGVARTWRAFCEQWGRSPSDIPASPLPGIALQDIETVAMQVRGGARDPRGAIPMPARLAPGAENAERHDAPLPGWEHIPRVISGGDGLVNPAGRIPHGL